MNVNKHIIISTAGLMFIGFLKVMNDHTKPIGRVLIGGVVFMLVLSVVDLFGGEVSKLTSALAMLALTTGLLTEFPWSTIFTAVGVKAV